MVTFTYPYAHFANARDTLFLASHFDSTAVSSTILGTAVPVAAEDSDATAVELGMKFRSDIAGHVSMTIRFSR